MKKVLKVLLWIIVLGVFIGTFVYLYLNSRPAEMRYNVVEPTTGDIVRRTLLTGKIEPRDEIEIKPQISGIIAEVNVDPGVTVRKGDVIARIKVIPEESQLSSAQNRAEVAKISLDQTKREHERTRMLYDKKYVSREEFEQSEVAVQKAQSEYESALDALSIVREGISLTNAQESNTLVRATIDGLILEVPVKVGSSVIQANTMNEGTTIAKIADMSNLLFVGKVDETEVGQLREGMETTISIGALPDIKPLAVVEYIAPKSTNDNGSNTFEMKAAIEVPEGVYLRAGYSANADICLESVKNVVCIPEGVIEWSGDSTFVYVLKAEEPVQEWERRPVTTGVSDGVNIEVKSGITADDRLRGSMIHDN